jgi:alpha-1,6-mannosyltransferase
VKHLVLFILGQCALVAVTAMHGGMTVLDVRAPIDIFTTGGALFWIELALLAFVFAVYIHAARDIALPASTLWKALVVVTLLAVLQAPTTSRDVYHYVTLGRIAGVYGLDPYVAVYPIVPVDPFLPFVWYGGTSNYGPLAILVFVIAGWLSVVHPALGIVFLKLVSAGAHLACSWFVWRLAAALEQPPARALFLVGFNPLMLHELVGNGHNDGLAVMLALASLWLLHRERWRASAVVAWLPMLIKLSFMATSGATAVLLAVRRRFDALAIMIASFVAIAIVLYIALAPDLRQLLQITDPTAAGRKNSLFYFIELGLMRADLATPATALVIITHVAQVAMLGFAAIAVWRCTKIRSLEDLVAELAALLLALLLFGPRIWPWYLAWMLPFAVLSRSDRVRTVALWFSFTSLLLYLPSMYPTLRTAGMLSALLLPAVEWLVPRRSAGVGSR